MSIVELLLVAVALSMDAFAVSVCKGLSMRKLTASKSALVGLYFGGFQALMPLLGYYLGSVFSGYITRFDHWIAFFLLAFVGVNMIREAVKEDGECEDCAIEDLRVKTMLLLAIATSIDALAVGVSFAFLSVRILPAVGFIGATTFILSMGGVAIGHVFGARWKEKAEIAGGAALVLLGAKILFEHLGWLSF